MPMIGAIFGAILTGLLYWFLFGGGMAYVDAHLRSSGDKKRQLANAKRRVEAEADRAAAPLRSIKDPREAAIALMIAVAEARGVATPEQLACIRDRMADILGFGAGSGEDGEAQLAFARHAVSHAPSPDAPIDILAPLLREKLDPREREELRTCLERVAVLHGGPTDEQNRLIDRTMRRLREAA